MHDDNAPLIWLDMEMTGLDPDADCVLEIATLVTNGDLEVIAEGPDIVIHQPDQVLDAMGLWCREHHGSSGLTEASRRSKVTEADAEAQTLEFLARFCEPGKSPLCGNSIGQDRRFIYRYMPKLADFLHYRSIDVSTVKELARRWYPLLPSAVKAEAHRALDDIRESVAELRHYRASVFRVVCLP